MLPGKTYTPEDFLWMAWTRKWFILIPAVLIGSATYLWSHALPNRYLAETTILVVPQRVPESYVRSTVTADVGQRLQSISQQILSRSRLERIIEEFNLYERERQTLIMEDVVEQMRVRDIKLNLGAPARRTRSTVSSSFTVGFESSQPRTAMLVTERLASMFVQESLQDRELLADSTNQFLQAQLEDARRRLLDHEKKLEEFRRVNAGRLPSQATSNLQLLQAAQAQLQGNAEAASRERDRLSVIDTAIREILATGREVQAAGTTWWRTAEAIAKPGQRPRPGETQEGETLGGTAAQQLDAARAGLRNLELRFKPDHPDIGRAKRIVQELEIKAEAEALATPVAVASDGAEAEPELPWGNAGTQVAAMRLEAQQLRASLENRKREEQRLQGVMASYTSRLEATPALESAMTDLMRDYTTIREQYTALLRKAEESRIAVNLERRQIGEQFRIVDPARLPERPISPDRLRLNLMGLLAGLGLGLALAALREYRDTTFKTDGDIVASLSLPVLAIIPTMVTAVEHRRARRRRAVAFAVSCATVLLVAAVAAWRLELVQAWVP